MDIVIGVILGLLAGTLTSVIVRRHIPGGALEVVVGGIARALLVALIFALIAASGLHLTSFLLAFIGASVFGSLLQWLEQSEPRRTPGART
jgi:uncharacterized membrane protein YeaQ/YmgE (transglycosylase-associated protein family)